MIEIIEGTWAAGETKTYHVNGERIEILDAQYALDVYLMDKSGAQMSVMKKSEASFFSQPKEGFNSLQIYSAQAQYIRFFVGSGDAGTRRISSTVSVIDGGRARVDANVAYSAAANIAAPASNYPYGQLWNPVGSGRRIVVNQASVSLAATGGASLYWGTAQFPTDVSAAAIASKKSQAAAATGQLRTTIGTAQPAYPYGQLQGLGGTPGLYSVWKPTEPVIVMPGFGLNVVGGVIATGMAVNFEWFEEVI